MRVIIKNGDEQLLAIDNLVLYFTLNSESKIAKFKLNVCLDDFRYNSIKSKIVNFICDSYKIDVSVDNNNFALSNPEFVDSTDHQIIQLKGDIIEWN